MNKTVIYHSADYDGIFCREIARKFLPEADLIGWNFGDELINAQEHHGEIFILDLSPDCLVPGFDTDRITWIDHHKSSIEKWEGYDLQGYRIDGVAACRLAWQWFHRSPNDPLPGIESYIERKTAEPLAVRLAGEYDIWDKRDPRAEHLQYGLRSWASEDIEWERLLAVNNPYVLRFLEQGEAIQKYQQNIDAGVVANKSYLIEWEGLKFLTLNTARFNSLTFATKDLPETGHDALLGYCFTGKSWTVSMYHAKHRTELDLSKIAVKYGGGGHRGACGFVCGTLPFQPSYAPSEP